VPVVSISDAQRTPLPHAGWVGTVHHGMPTTLLRPGTGRGGYLAFLIVPTIVGGILSNNIEHGENFRLMAFAAVPIHTAEALYPVSPDPGDPSNTAWVLVWLGLIAVSALVLVWRFWGEEA
jgi:hypothetical protein